MRFDEKLVELLKSDSRFVDDEGELVKAAVIDRAWKIDRNLVKLLLSKPEIKTKFFDEIEGHWIFNINTFIEYIADKHFLANSYTRFRNKIGLNIDDKFLRERGEVSLVWPYKDCVLEGGQTKEEEKRKEIFFNEILAQDEIDRLFDPKVLTNWKRYTVDGEEQLKELRRDEKGTIRENLIIKGNNLLALHTLKKQFQGKVKLIYIDPPFNTSGAANTFSYNNSFNHSAWLTFMKNRIEVAKEMLKQDGIFVVAIDHYELFYLGVLCDEIFGRNNRIGVISVVHNPGGRQDDIFFPTAHENMIFCAKDISCVKLNTLGRFDEKLSQYKLQDSIGRYKLRGFRRSGNNSKREQRPRLFYPIYYNPKTNKISLNRAPHYIEILPIDEQGIERCWRWGSETFLKRIERYIEIKNNKKGYDIYIKEREEDYQGEKAKTIWIKPYYTGQTATNELKKLFGSRIFNYPKSPFLMMDIVRITTLEDDLVLDFFSGSATTAAVAHKMNRQWITVEQMNYVETISVERLKKVIGKKLKKNGEMFEKIECDQGGIAKAVNWQGGGDFVYCELMKYNEAFMDKIQAAKTSEELIGLWKDIAQNSFLNWYVNPEMPEQAVNDFVEIGKAENGLDKQKHLLAELLNKNQLYMNFSEIDDKDFGISDEDKLLNRSFYGDNL
jgi:adenine-specific DNA-methyltransferase